LLAAQEFAKDTPVQQICAIVGMKPAAVFNWKRAWKSGGTAALAAKPVPGRAPALPDDRLAELAGLILDHTPADQGFAQALWTKTLIATLIEQRYGVSFEPDWVGKLMRRMGFAPQRIRCRAGRDSATAAAWRAEAYPAIREQAARAGATIYFTDQTRLRSHCPAGAASASADRDTLSMISAIEQRGRIHFAAFTGTADCARFASFVEALLSDDGGTVVLILDNEQIHASERVRAFAARTEGRLRLFTVPGTNPGR
jgi:transposase